MSRPKRTTFSVTVYRKRGKAWLRVRPPTGTVAEYLQEPETDDPEAEAAQVEARMNASLGKAVSVRDPRLVDVYELHVLYRQTDPKTRPNTRRSYMAIRGAVAQAFGELRESGLDKAAVLAAQDRLLRAGRAKSYVNLVLQKCSHAWEWARDTSVGNVSKPWPEVGELQIDQTERRPAKATELDALLRQAQAYDQGRLLPLFLLLGDVGSRISETLQLREQDVDRVAGSVTFRAATTKGNRTRSCKVTPEILALLPIRPRPTDWLFPSPMKEGKPRSSRGVLGALHTMLERAGLENEPLVLHSLRGYVVRKLHTAGVALKDAMAFLGHRSVKVHLGYMEGDAGPGQDAILAAARKVHDPLANLVPGLSLERPETCPISFAGNAYPISDRTR